MGVTTVSTLDALLEASNAALLRAQGEGAAATLIVPSHAWGQQRKLQLRTLVGTGVDVVTHAQFVSQLWDVYGDGSTIVAPAERKVLLRPLITQVALFDTSPSPDFVTQLAAFVEEAIYPGLCPSTALSNSESKLMELVSLYEAKLEHEGLVELAQAEHALMQEGACRGMHLVFEAPDLHSAHLRRFIAGIEPGASVSVIRQHLDISAGALPEDDELLALRQRLFTGKGGVRAQGHVRVGEAHGAHVASDVVTGLVRSMHEKNGIGYADMLVCCASAADAYPRLHDAFARAGVPFATQFAMPCARTGLGAAFFALETIVQAGDDAPFEPFVDVLCGPYAGVPAQDARALQMRWREQAGSVPYKRMRDVREGFAQGNASAAITRERLEPLVQLIDASRAERVRLLFEHARSAQLDVDTLVDDCAAAEALLDYLELCERFICEPDADEMANLPVTLNRSYGNQEEALRIVDPGALGTIRAGAIILCDLDACHYPMALQGGPFDALMRKLGIERADTLARDQRIMLLNAIESCEDCFAFTRTTHDAGGDESCPSALFEELVAAYRSSEEDEAGLSVQAVPQALRPWLLALNEADVFFASEGPHDDVSVTRGSLALAAMKKDLTHDLKDKPLTFSPTALEDYYRCPYRWFACRRVGYNGMDVTFDAAAQGNLVHATMERFYRCLKQTGHDRVTEQNVDEALVIANKAFDQQLEDDQSRERRGLYLRTEYDSCACEELRQQVFGLVRRDATFLPGFIPTYFELELGRSSERLLEYAGVPVRGKVDRVDVDAEGNAIIIDYKLSGLSAGYGFGRDDELPQRIQTDIYATLVERHFAALGTPLHVVGSVYRSYAKNALRGVYARGIPWGDTEQLREDFDALPRAGSDEGYDAYLTRVEDVLASCVERLRAGDIAPAPLSSDVCEYCKAASFCPKGGA